MLAIGMTLATADSLERIANVFVKDGLRLRHVEFSITDTRHFQNFIPRNVGTVKLDKGEYRYWFRPVKKTGGAIMDVRQIRLIPVKQT
ncbi:MAG TPA: hypothetical protein QGG93_02455 [Verrucomicrobiota bacterium]|nr:hypothetical protein [Verrucomicrobiota bacterium]